MFTQYFMLGTANTEVSGLLQSPGNYSEWLAGGRICRCFAALSQRVPCSFVCFVAFSCRFMRIFIRFAILSKQFWGSSCIPAQERTERGSERFPRSIFQGNFHPTSAWPRKWLRMIPWRPSFWQFLGGLLLGSSPARPRT